MKLKILFGFFVFLMFLQFAASFHRGFGLGVFQGFRMYERTGRFICRAEFAGVRTGVASESVKLSSELATGDAKHDFVKFKIYNWDWAEKLGLELCEKRTDFTSLQIQLACRRFAGFSKPEIKVMPCPLR